MNNSEEITVEKDGIVTVYKAPVQKEGKDEDPTELKKAISNVGNFVFIYSLIQIIAIPIYYLFTSKNFLLSSFFIILFYMPLIVCGKSIKKNDFSNLKKLKTLIIFCIIYCLLIAFVAMTQGGTPTILIIILLFSLFNANGKFKKLEKLEKGK